MAKKHVFISFGTPYAEPQREFLKALLALLRKCNMEPRAVNMTEYSTENPLKVISRIMHECDAVIIVAYERTYFDSGFEKRKSAQEKKLAVGALHHAVESDRGGDGLCARFAAHRHDGNRIARRGPARAEL